MLFSKHKSAHKIILQLKQVSGGGGVETHPSTFDFNDVFISLSDMGVPHSVHIKQNNV